MAIQRVALSAAVAVAYLLAAPAARAEDEFLDLLVGSWDVTVENVVPQPGEMSYRETYRWMLGGEFLEGRTEGRADGVEDLIVGTYDQHAEGYPFWFFSSSGTYLYLAPGKWDARTRTLEWTNPAGSDITYTTRVTFPDARTRRWTIVIEDWKGTVLVRQEGRAARRGD